MEQRSLMPGMNNASKLSPQLAARLLLTAGLLGLAAGLLLRAMPPGLNVPVLVVSVLVGGVGRRRWGGMPFHGEGRWLVGPMLVFSACLAWRDSPTLNVANAVALVGVACLAAFSARAGQLRMAGLSQYALGVTYVLGNAAAGLLPT